MAELDRPLYPGPFGSDFTMPPFDGDHESVEAMQTPLAVDAPEVTLSAEAEDALRIGIGRTDMEIRWMASLDEFDTLRLWRSWTGHEIYRATFERQPAGLKLVGLQVESADELHRIAADEQPGQRFLQTLRHCLSLITPKAR